MQAPTEQPLNKLVRQSSQISMALSVFLIAFFSLANAGQRFQIAFFAATVVIAISGVYAATLLKEKADFLNLKSAAPSPAVIRCAICLPLSLLVAFAGLLAVQFW